MTSPQTTGLLLRCNNLPAGASHRPGLWGDGHQAPLRPGGHSTHGAPTGPGRAVTSPSALAIGESRMKSGGAITSTRATASSFSCGKTKVIAWQHVSMATVEEQSLEFVAGPAGNRNPGMRPDSGSIVSSGRRRSLGAPLNVLTVLLFTETSNDLIISTVSFFPYEAGTACESDGCAGR